MYREQELRADKYFESDCEHKLFGSTLRETGGDEIRSGQLSTGLLVPAA
jgi:hypothetical protein